LNKPSKDFTLLCMRRRAVSHSDRVLNQFLGFMINENKIQGARTRRRRTINSLKFYDTRVNYKRYLSAQAGSADDLSSTEELLKFLWCLPKVLKTIKGD
jgi:hypothetical protein